MHTDYDIGIVGGGLAGLSLAVLSASAGYSVVLLEKETYPFHKVCGEYISLESYDFLERLGLPLKEWSLPVIKKLQVSDTKGKVYNFQLDLGGFGVSRFTIDNALYNLAKQKGVHVCINQKVNDIGFENDQHIIQTNTKTVTAKVVAGSFGKRSNLDIKWKRAFTEKKANKLNNYIGVKYHIKTDFPRDHIALHNFKNGYCGISAIEDDKYCLCYLTNAENLATNNNLIEEMQENTLYKNPVLKNIFSKSEFLYDAPLAISQISFDKKEQIENHVIMLGDAAGMIAPLCGNGMSMAMHSAQLAFNEMEKYLQQKILREKMERSYVINWKKKFGSRLATGRMIQRFMGSELSTGIFLKLMNAFPFLSTSIIRSSHGQPF